MSDKVDDFFEHERESVPLLAPPPGRYDQLHTVAHRRRNRNTTVVSVAAVVVLAIVGTGGLLSSGVLRQSNVSTATTPTGHLTSVPVPAASPVATPVPVGFTAWSVTFASRSRGWALGGYPCQGSQQCVAVIETTDAMASWHTVSKPGLSAEYGIDAGTAILRFADAANGWMVGSQGVWSTHDGGHNWRPIAALQSERVDALETHGSYTYAMGRGQDRLWVSSDSATDTTWKPVTVGIGYAAGTENLQIANRTVVVSRTVGRATSMWRSPNNGATWTALAPPCTSSLVMPLDENTFRFVCDDGRVMSYWLDGRNKTKVAGRVTLSTTTGAPVAAHAVTTDGVNTVVAYSGAGIWAVGVGDDVTRRAQPGDFSWVGLTAGSQGIALPLVPSGTYWITINSGQSWISRSWR